MPAVFPAHGSFPAHAPPGNGNGLVKELLRSINNDNQFRYMCYNIDRRSRLLIRSEREGVKNERSQNLLSQPYQKQFHAVGQGRAESELL